MVQTLAAIIAATVSTVAVCVTGYFAWHQRELTKAKLRLDLYDRRFKIFTSIFDFYEAMIAWRGTAEQVETRTHFFRAYQEAGFLFSKDSGIQDLLKLLNDEGAKVIGFKEHHDSYKSDTALYIQQFKETNDIQLRVFE
ncbi:MAG TPA: hypothetical protein VMM15_14910, partial [Bradyrhizobium sp.]|nr:hypothetical protein [Bradyrhizobium sp.]